VDAYIYEIKGSLVISATSEAQARSILNDKFILLDDILDDCEFEGPDIEEVDDD